MSTTLRRRTQAERRQEAERAILDAAIGIVAEKGLDELTLADAGEAAGYSRGLPSHYFGSKAELYSAIAEHIREWFFGCLQARASRTGLPSLIAGIDFYFDACRRHRSMLQVLHMVLGSALHMPALAKAVARLNRDSIAAIENDIRAGIAKGEIRRNVDVPVAAALLLASVRGVIAQWLVDPGHVDLAALRASLVDQLKKSLVS